MGRELSPENPLYQVEETAEADSEGLEDIDSLAEDLAEDLDFNMDAGEVEPPVAETGDVSDEAGKEEGLDFDIDLSYDSAKEDEPDSVEFTPPEVVDEAPEVDVDMDSVEPDMVDQDSPLDIDLEDFDNMEVSDSAEEEETQGDGELADMDEVSTKLDLARAYVDMGDPDGAKSILDEVMEEGSEEQKEEARGILGQMA
jgi:pilus assembly protein FimV